MIENLDTIRKNTIAEIKEKIKKNPGPSGYMHPCNKERQEDIRKLGFENGNKFVNWIRNWKKEVPDKWQNSGRKAKEKYEKGSLLWLKEEVKKKEFENLNDWCKSKSADRKISTLTVSIGQLKEEAKNKGFKSLEDRYKSKIAGKEISTRTVSIGQLKEEANKYGFGNDTGKFTK